MKLRLSRKLLAAQLPLAVVAALSTSAATAPSAAADTVTTQQAQAADSFVDSIGVATHLTYAGTPYTNYPLVQQRLQESGIRHLRDGWGTGSAYASSFVEKQLHPLGIGITMVQDPRQGATPAALKDMVKTQLPTSIDAVEGLNEWDVTGSNWAGAARDWTIQVAQAYRGDAATKNIPIVAGALADTNTASKYQALGNISAYVDYGNTHDYPGNQFHMNDAIINTVLANNAITAPGKKVYATETGFSTGNVGAPYQTMPEAQVAQALPKLYLDHFRRGIVRSFSYELFDQHADDQFESKFGLLRNDGSPKPSFTAVSNMIGLLSDRGSAFTPGSLDYELQGQNASTRTLLLQKRDGTFWLAVWQQDRTWNGSSVLNPADVPLTLKLGSAVTTARVYDPVRSRAALATTSNTASVQFASTEGVTLVELAGKSSAPVTPVTPTPNPAPVTPPATTPVTTPATSVPVSSLPLQQVANAWGPAELNRSNGEGAAGDGRTLSISGTTFPTGIGVHAGSDLHFANTTGTTFTSTVGVDDEVGANGSVVFQVFTDGTKVYDSGLVTRATGSRAVSVDIRGTKDVRLVVTDGGNGNLFDHADWANAKVLSAAVGTVQPAPVVPRAARRVSKLPLTTLANGWGPVELDRSNGEAAAGDGRTLKISGASFTNGLGVHAGSDVRFANDGASTFAATVGLDDEVGTSGSVVFQVLTDGAKVYDSGLVTRATGAKRVAVSVKGKKEIRLVVSDGGDGNAHDHADWADATLAD